MIEDGMLVRSGYIDMLKDVSGSTGIVKVITGMRCIGKTVTARQFAREYSAAEGTTVLDYDFDGVAGLNMKDSADVRMDILDRNGGSGRTVILLHEFQKIPGWMDVLEELVPLGVGEFFLTASDDSVMALKRSKTLQNSVIEIRMYPLTLREFMEFNDIISVKTGLDEYLRVGGLPVVRASLPNDVAETILNGILATALLKDVLPYAKGIVSPHAMMVAKQIIVD